MAASVVEKPASEVMYSKSTETQRVWDMPCVTVSFAYIQDVMRQKAINPEAAAEAEKLLKRAQNAEAAAKQKN